MIEISLEETPGGVVPAINFTKDEISEEDLIYLLFFLSSGILANMFANKIEEISEDPESAKMILDECEEMIKIFLNQNKPKKESGLTPAEMVKLASKPVISPVKYNDHS
jgi:flagellar biosynthesis protein FliP